MKKCRAIILNLAKERIPSGDHAHIETEKSVQNIQKQEGQDGPGSLTWIFKRTIANFFFLSLSEKNLQEFL